MLNTIGKIILYSFVGYLLVALFAPSMSFWDELSSIFSFVFYDFPLVIVGSSLLEWAETLGEGASIAVMFLTFALVIIYYVTLFVIIVVFAGEQKPTSAMWKNELNWVLGLTTNKDIIKAEVQANEIVNALEQRSKR